MRFNTIYCFVLALVFFCEPCSANAGMTCSERNTILPRLEEEYSEVPVARGLASDQLMVEVLASSDGSFTIIATRPDGVSCVLAAGDTWHDVSEPSAKPSF